MVNLQVLVMHSLILWLKNIDSNRGIRDIESILSLAKKEGLLLINDFDMPANNQLLVFKKSF